MVSVAVSFAGGDDDEGETSFVHERSATEEIKIVMYRNKTECMGEDTKMEESSESRRIRNIPRTPSG